MQNPSPAASPSNRILIVRLSAHGDIIHTLPLLAAIKRDKPDVQVGWLVDESAVGLLENHPLVDRLHVVRRRAWMKALRDPRSWSRILHEVRGLLQELRQADYSVSLDAQGLFKSAVWPWLAGIPRRCGFRHTREQADRFYNDKRAPIDIEDANTPAVHQFLTLAAAVGCRTEDPVFVVPTVSPQRLQRMDQLLADAAAQRSLVVLAPFTRWPSKHWRFEHWMTLIPELLALETQPVLLGAPGDLAEVERLLATLGPERAGGIINLVGRTDWPDLYALFARTRLMIGLDSAPIHIANAVGIPYLIGIYGPTPAGRTGPIGDRQTILSTQLDCQPCFKRKCPLQTHACMIELTPARVLAEVRRVLETVSA